MKHEIIVCGIFTFVTALASQVRADDNCCGGLPLAADSICCNDQQVSPEIYICCSSAQETAWQQAYNTCQQGAKSTETSTLADEDSEDASVVAGIEQACVAAGTACGPNPSVSYDVCYYAAETASADPRAIEATIHSGLRVGTEIDYNTQNDACAAAEPGSSSPICADNWKVTEAP